MMRDEWKYYNHQLVSALPPDEIPCLENLESKDFWKNWGEYILFARWCTDFDCSIVTDWWYVIKDEPFDISLIKAKRRYEINKGRKNFDVKEILPTSYRESIYEVTIEAYSSWPEKYRPVVNKKMFMKNIDAWDKSVVIGGFDRKTGELCGYAVLNETERHVEFNVLRVRPEHEKNAINAAMVDGIIEKYNARLGKNYYINDGSRAIRHETAFQDYLEKYFGFRKAYCKLKIKYRFPFGVMIKMIYPFRSLISDKSKMGSVFSSLLRMEEISRSCN